MKLSFKTTINACFIGYIVQAIINNFIPLLFVTFQNTYNIELGKITLLITINFIVQLLVDMLSVKFIDKIGYRTSIVLAHLFSAVGLILLPILPNVIDSFTGILISVILYAIGGGIIEVLISPIMEACPTENKEKSMSLLHSFYCWGHVGVVLISTIFFIIFKIENWWILSLIWAAIPIINAIIFIKAPINKLNTEDNGSKLSELFKNKIFWLLLIMMICAGASEQAVSQWASSFAEKALNIDKSIGDLFGPMMFAIMMGISRVIFGKFGDKISLDKYMIFSAILCIAAYLLISLSPIPILSLIGCAVCGFSVGILWPGTFSKSSKLITNGGTALFAILALGGDFGCSMGPTLVGFISDYFDGDLKIGILCAILFPILLIISTLILKKRDNLF